MKPQREIFEEAYRVLAVENQSLTVQGVRSGKVLTIVNETPGSALSAEKFPAGTLIALTDPGSSQAH